MIQVGVTGGIGSGKSTVCKIFRVLGIPVFDADQEAKLLYVNNPSVQQEIIRAFGDDIYPKGIFSKQNLARKVFGNTVALNQLNQIIHPKIRELGKQWFQDQKTPYAIKEAALLIESGHYQELDYLVLVNAQKEERIRRVMERNQVTREEVLLRMKHQMDDHKKKKYAHFVIENDNSSFLIPQVVDLHSKFMSL